MNEFLWPVRVYYEDTDTAGVVYYANYLKFMERARTELLRSLGFEQDELRESNGVIFAVHSLQVEYRIPARFNDLLQVSATIKQSGKASITFDQQVCREPDQALLCSGKVKIACLNASNLRPTAIPDSIRKEINRAD